MSDTYIGLILPNEKDVFEDMQRLSAALKKYTATTRTSCNGYGCDYYAHLTREAGKDNPDRVMMFIDDNYLAQVHGKIHDIAYNLGIEYLHFLEASNGWADISAAHPSDDDFEKTEPFPTPEKIIPEAFALSFGV